MNTKLLGALQALLWFVCAFHLFVGIGLNVSGAFPQVVAQYYGATVEWTPEFLYIVKPIGAFMIAVGIMAGVAAMNPLANRAVIYGLVALFVIRGLQRIVFQDEIASALAIAGGRNIGNAVFFLLLAGTLFFVFRAAAQRAPGTV
jgi:hypothetical protein